MAERKKSETKRICNMRYWKMQSLKVTVTYLIFKSLSKNHKRDPFLKSRV